MTGHDTKRRKMKEKLRIQKMTFSKAHLRLLEKKERKFFVGASHIANEISLLSKWFQWTIARPKSEIERQVMVAQGLMLGRLLSGKLHECWKYLEIAFFNAKFSKNYSEALNSESKAALKELKNYFSSSNMITSLRNEFSFHYDPAHYGIGYELLDEDTSLEIYFGEHNANTLFSFSDEIIGRGMVNAINPADKAVAMEKFRLETSKIAGLISVFLGGCMRLVIEKHLLGKESVEVSMLTFADLPNWSEVKIPFFTQSPSHFYFKLDNGKTLTWGEQSVSASPLFQVKS